MKAKRSAEAAAFAAGRVSGLRAAQAAAKRVANKNYHNAAGRSECREAWEQRAAAEAAWHIGELLDVQILRLERAARAAAACNARATPVRRKP